MNGPKLIARNGVFDQANEEYRVLGQHGIPEIDWTPTFSAAADAYERLTGEETDSAHALVYTNGVTGEEEEYLAFEAVCGDEREGIALLDGEAYEFWEGEAIRKATDDEWTSLDGSLYRVVPNGDETEWEEIDSTDA